MVFRKRGSTHIDWVISLGIFLFYIVWFFVFINPQISQAVELTPIGYSVKDMINTKSYETLVEMPVFLKIGENRTDKLIIIDYTPKYGDNKFFFKNDEYYFHNNKLYLLKDYSTDNILIELVESDHLKNQTYLPKDISIKNNKVSTSKNFLAEFEKSKLKRINYKDNDRITNIKIKLDEDEISIKNEINLSTELYYQKKLLSQRINISTNIFARNSIIFLSTEKNDKNLNKKISMNMEINQFNQYFIDTSEFGDITLNKTKCKEQKGDYIKFYDNYDSLNFILPNDTNIKICFNEKNVSLTLQFPNKQINEAYIIFDDKTYTKNNFFDYTYKTGIIEESTILNFEKLNNLNYELLKKELGLSDDRNFQITVWNNTLSEISRNQKIIEIGIDRINTNNVYVNEYADYINLGDGIKNSVTVGIKVW